MLTGEQTLLTLLFLIILLIVNKLSLHLHCL